MKINIDFMAPYAESIARSIEIDIEEGCSLGLLVERLKNKYSILNRSFNSDIDRPVITVNKKIVFNMDEVLHDGDDLIIFPPVGGG